VISIYIIDAPPPSLSINNTCPFLPLLPPALSLSPLPLPYR